MAEIRIVEGVESTYHYHLAGKGWPSKALCGARTMRTEIPLDVWGSRGHLSERYCATCEAAASYWEGVVLGDEEEEAADDH